MYEIGKIYIWQNCGGVAHLNGTETTVLSAPQMYIVQDGTARLAQLTDTLIAGRKAVATAGRLRPKNPPPGEQLVRDLFEKVPTDLEMEVFHSEQALAEWRDRSGKKIADFWRRNKART